MSDTKHPHQEVSQARVIRDASVGLIFVVAQKGRQRWVFDSVRTIGGDKTTAPQGAWQSLDAIQSFITSEYVTIAERNQDG